MGKRHLFNRKDERTIAVGVYMKSDHLGWDEMLYADGRRHIDDLIMDAPENIDIFFSTDDASVYISSEEGSESFWYGYNNLIDQHYRNLRHPLPSFNRARKTLRKKYFKAGDKAIIDNLFVEIHILFYADCIVEHTPMEAPYFCYTFKFQ